MNHAREFGDQVLLAIDTALGTSVALGFCEQIVEVFSDDPRGHAEVIGGLLAQVFEQAQITPAAVTAVVAGIGPGPFTGLRVGIAAAKAFSVARAVPLLPLHSHEAVALAALEAGAAVNVRVVQDAKRRELFITEYSTLNWAGVPTRDEGPYLAEREGYQSVSHELWPTRIPAGHLVRLAARRLATGLPFEADQALYLRAPDVKPAGPIKRVSA